MAQNVTVLIVEDEPLVLLTMQDALEQKGFSVFTATSGADALAIVENQIAEIAGVVVDVQLGDGPNGWDVASRARKLKPFLPVVYATAEGVKGWAANGVSESVLVQKPYGLERIVSVLSGLINPSAVI